MKMFLTRLGFGSKIVITGDITQIDLPADKVSGLREAMRVLKGVEDISILPPDGERRGPPRCWSSGSSKAYEEDGGAPRSQKGQAGAALTSGIPKRSRPEEPPRRVRAPPGETMQREEEIRYPSMEAGTNDIQ